MSFKILVLIELIIFIITSLLLVILSVAVGGMKKVQFARLLSLPGSRKNLVEFKAQLSKVDAVLSRVKGKAVISCLTAIISLMIIWFLLHGKYISRPIDAETILLGIAAIAPVPVVIFILEYCVNQMLKRVDALIVEGE